MKQQQFVHEPGCLVLYPKKMSILLLRHQRPYPQLGWHPRHSSEKMEGIFLVSSMMQIFSEDMIPLATPVSKPGTSASSSKKAGASLSLAGASKT